MNIKKKWSEKGKKGKKMTITNVCFFAGVLILLVIIGWLVYMHLYGYGFWNITSNKNIYPNQIAKYEATIPQHNLPSAPWPFVGRNKELEEITALFYDGKKDIIVINGPPAFGKSALAIHVGHSMLQKNIDVAYIDAPESPLFQWSDSKAFHSHTDVSSFSVETDDNIVKSGLIEWAKSLNRTSLLILDNLDNALEQNRDSSLNFILKLYESAQPQMLKVLITSQTHITFLGRFQQFNLGELEPASASELLNTLTNVEINGSERLVEMVGFCPLTITVVAALLNKPKMQGSEWLLAELEKNVISISCVDDTFPKNHCWKALMDTAYNKLSNENRDCGHYIGFFPGSFGDYTATQMLKEPTCVNKLVESSLTEKYVTNHHVRYIMHRLIREYFRNKASDLNMQQTFEMEFQDHFSQLAYNISTEPNFTSDPSHLEAHNWKHLVSIVTSTGQPTSSELLISVAFIHSEHLLPTNVSWLNLFNFYNTHDFMQVCELFGGRLCSDVLAETIENIHKNRPLISCSLLSTLSIELIYRIKHLISDSQCYCDMQMNVIKYFLLNPLFCLFLKCSVDIIAHLTFPFFKIKYSQKIYIYRSQLFNMYIFIYFYVSAIILYFFFHPLTTHALCDLPPYTLHLTSLLGLFSLMYYCYQNVHVSKNDGDNYRQEFGKLGFFNMYIIVTSIVAVTGISHVLTPLAIAKFIHSPYDRSIAMAVVTYCCIFLSSILCFLYACTKSQHTSSKHGNFDINKLPGYFNYTLYIFLSLDRWILSVFNKISLNNVYVFLCATYTICTIRLVLLIFICICFPLLIVSVLVSVLVYVVVYVYAYIIGYTSFYPFLH